MCPQVSQEFSIHSRSPSPRRVHGPDVLVPTRGTLDDPQPGRSWKIAPRGGTPQPRRCSKIVSRLSDSGEAFPVVWIRAGRELAVVLHPIPARLDRPKIRLVFTDVMGNCHFSSPKFLRLIVNQHWPWRISTAAQSVQFACTTQRFTCSLRGSPAAAATLVVSARTSSAWDVSVLTSFCQ